MSSEAIGESLSEAETEVLEYGEEGEGGAGGNSEQVHRLVPRAGGRREEAGAHRGGIRGSNGSRRSRSRERSDEMRGGRVRGSAPGGGAARNHHGGGFRITGKQFAITYPRCEVLRDRFDQEFKSRHAGLEEYHSAREDHKDGGKHIHVFVSYRGRKDVSSARYFDITIDGITYHPNIQKCKNRRDWIKYISKGDDSSLSGDCEFNPLLEKLGDRKRLHADWEWSLEYNIQRQLKPIQWPIRLVTEQQTYEMVKPVIGEDGKYVKKRNWWIKAEPNAGKTYWINKTFGGYKIWMPRMGKYPFEGYNGAEIVIYDDREAEVTFAEFSDVCNVWNIVKPIYGEVRFRTQNWPLNAIRCVIVLSNKMIEDVFQGTHLNAMKKRFIQILNPKLKEEDSDTEEEQKQEEHKEQEMKVDEGLSDTERREQAQRGWRPEDFVSDL